MSFAQRLSAFLGFAFLAGFVLFMAPTIDLGAAKLFFEQGVFAWRNERVALFFHDLVQPISFVLAGLFAVAIFAARFRKLSVLLPLFMLLALVIGPGLITNTVFKDNWGRARPYQTTEFGGTKNFSRVLVMDDECRNNCSFVGGDAAFGYWFHSFAYVVPQRRRRTVFWAGMGVGLGYSVLRVGMGAHFLSDVFFAAIVVLLSSASLFALLFGRMQLKARWQDFLGGK